jgi:uncharacterized membrane protein
MSIARWLGVYLLALLVVAVADGLWLLVLMKDFYQGQIGALMRPAPLLAPALLFYLLYPAGLVYFCLYLPAPGAPPGAVALRCAVFGLLVYAVYDLTNLSTLRGWTWQVSLVDMLWGALAAALAGTAARLLAGRL